MRRRILNAAPDTRTGGDPNPSHQQQLEDLRRPNPATPSLEELTELVPGGAPGTVTEATPSDLVDPREDGLDDELGVPDATEGDWQPDTSGDHPWADPADFPDLK